MHEAVSRALEAITARCKARAKEGLACRRKMLAVQSDLRSTCGKRREARGRPAAAVLERQDACQSVGRVMVPALNVLGSLAVLSIGIGALCWAVGYVHQGKRAIVFGIVLAVVGGAVARQGAALFGWARAHAEVLALALVGAVVLLAILRFAWSLHGGKGDAKLSKKRRVQSGP